MNWENIVESKIVTDLGTTLFHSIWQIAMLSLGLFTALSFSRRGSANFRYLISLSAMVLAFLIPVLTFVYHSQTSNRSAGIFSFSGHSPELFGEYFPSPDVLPHAIAKGGTIIPETKNVSLSGSLRHAIPSLFPATVGFWLLGVALFSIRILGGFRQVRRYKAFGISKADESWLERFAALSARLDVKDVELQCSALLATPIVVGFWKHIIIVPTAVFLQMQPHELETIIAHELVHIRRYDPLANMAQNLIETILFYHPGVWWISRQIRLEREFAADEAVVSIFNGSRVSYASALANLEEIRHLTSTTTPSIVTAANGGNLMQRISKILEKNTEIRRANSAWPAGLALMFISAVITGSLWFNASSLVNARSKTGERKLAIGFVSIPPVDRSETPPKDAVATTQLLIEKLRSHKVPAIGFVQGERISDGQKPYPVRAQIVKMWLDEGFEIGVGGYKHLWFYDTPYDTYAANIEKNIEVANPILAEKGRKLRYFSYPFLNTGKTNEDRIRFEYWLRDRGLTPVKYTIDNQEWMYSYAYDMARNDNDVPTMTEIRVEFIKYMNAMFDHYEKYSQEMFGRDIAQTMVLTPSRLVADSAHDLFGMIEKRGYRFVTMEEALSEPAFQTSEDWSGKAGISWFERWQMKQGKPLLLEPAVDQNIEDIWKKKATKK